MKLKRFSFNKAVLTILLTCTPLVLFAANRNFLFIISDDLSVDIASYGHDIVKTPNLDKLREKSMVFNRAYSQYPLCNPSRNSILSGLYPGTSGNLNNQDNIRDLIPDIVTLPKAFKDAGYLTATSGKVFHQKDPHSWTHISDMNTGGLWPTDQEPEFYRQWGQENKTKGEGRLLVDDTVPWFEWRSVTEGEEYLKDHQIAQATVNRMDDILEAQKPFFLAVGFLRPHDPFFAPKRFFDMYPLESLELPEAPNDASPVPRIAFYDVFKDAFEKMGRQDELEAMRSYYAGISYMDEKLGVVMDAMEEKGLLENTVIVFMSDHGYHVGEKGYWNKATLFERSCRAPLMIAYPGMPNAGATTDRLVEFVDIFPTLTELGGIDAPKGVDGESLVPLLKDPNAPWDEVVYSYVNQDRSVRTPDYRYILWRNEVEALYDVNEDAGEHYNLADNPEYKPVVERMRSLMKGMPEPNR